MTTLLSFDDILDAAIDAVSAGESVEAVVSRFPGHAGELRPLLEMAAATSADAARRPAPLSHALADNFAIVGAAVERAHMASLPESQPMQAPRQAPHWWQRPLTFASMTLPAGLVALVAFAGVSGAAAASMAVSGNTSLTDGLAHVARQVTPDWVPGTGSSASPAHQDNQPIGGKGKSGANPTNGNRVATPGAAGLPGGAPGTPGSANAPQAVTMAGTITDVHGNVFTLSTSDGDLKVNIDGTTKVTGAVVDGAAATVTGEITAEKNLHATSVDVTASAGQPPEATPTPHENNGNGSASDNTPGPPADHTPGPPADHTPPGQSGTGGGGGGSGNANATASANGNGGGTKKP